MIWTEESIFSYLACELTKTNLWGLQRLPCFLYDKRGLKGVFNVGSFLEVAGGGDSRTFPGLPKGSAKPRSDAIRLLARHGEK